MKAIPLTHGKEAFVDDEDYDYLSQWKWSLEPRRRSCYVRRKQYGLSRSTNVYLHQVVAERGGLGQGPGDIDHIDGNGLNNQRTNLRAATRSQNNANQRISRRNRSGFKGVYWSRAARKWAAQIGVSGKHKYLGVFSTETEAARAYNLAALMEFGEFARLNSV